MVADSILWFFGLFRRNHVADVFGLFYQHYVAGLFILFDVDSEHGRPFRRTSIIRRMHR